jgi:nitrate reductase alpha subunit
MSCVALARDKIADLGGSSRGGFVRASWDEAVELAAAAHVHTIRTWGHALTNGTPTAKVVPATPRKKPPISRAASER